MTVLSVADRLATRGRGAERAIAAHLELARQMLGEALAWRGRSAAAAGAGRRARPARWGSSPGPSSGGLLAELEEASFAGEIATREQAIERARELLAAAPAP